jgi:hypothetical protein
LFVPTDNTLWLYGSGSANKGWYTVDRAQSMFLHFQMRMPEGGVAPFTAAQAIRSGCFTFTAEFESCTPWTNPAESRIPQVCVLGVRAAGAQDELLQIRVGGPEKPHRFVDRKPHRFVDHNGNVHFTVRPVLTASGSVHPSSAGSIVVQSSANPTVVSRHPSVHLRLYCNKV